MPAKYAARLSRLLIAMTLFMSGTSAHCAESASDAAIKTAFLYNFFKFIDWPEIANHQDTYNLCITHDDHFGDNLAALNNKVVASKPLAVHRDIADQALKNCHIVFISNVANSAGIIRDLHGMPLITVSDNPNFIDQGGVIGLIQIDNHLSFEINLDAANTNGVHISAQLLKLAKRVIAAK
jgi:hypothetical protein